MGSNASRFTKLRRLVATLCAACLLCTMLCVMLGACASATVHTAFGLGAVLKLVCYQGGEEWYAHAQTLLNEVEQAVDCDRPASDLARFNAASVGEEVQVGAVTYQLFGVAQTAYTLCEGGYDPTSYWSVDLWGFSPRAQNGGSAMPYDRQDNALPQEEYVAAFRMLCDLTSIRCEQRAEGYFLCKTKSVQIGDTLYTTALDLGGVAKGWVVQRLLDKAALLGIDRGYVDFGSSSVGLMANRKGGNWDLSLRHPLGGAGQTYCTYPLCNRVVATSGDYENYYVTDGVRYCHVIDPQTGRPVQNGVHSVTVLGQDAALCDALSTGLMAKGVEFIQQFAQSEQRRLLGLDVVVVYGDENNLQCYTTLSGLDVRL